MAQLRPPKIEISGVPLAAESVAWAMTTGARSGRVTITVHTDVSDALSRLKNPVSLSFDCPQARGPGLSGQDVEENQVTFNRLYLLEIKEAPNPFFRTWILGDRRHFWETIKLVRFYNVHWGGYINRQLLPRAGRKFADYTIIKDIRYAQWSLQAASPKARGTVEKGATSCPGMEVPTNDASNKGKPWTAYQIALDILCNVCKVPGRDIIIDGELKDNGHQPENWIFDGEDLPSALQRAMNAAEMNLYQGTDGKLHLFSIFDETKAPAIIKQVGQTEGSQHPIRQNLSRIRPGRVVCFFDREIEIRFDYKESNERIESVEKTGIPPLSLENVLPLPDTIEAKGKTFPRGSWVRVEEAIQFWNTDTANPQPRGKTLSLKEIQRHWLGQNKLEFFYASDFFRPNRVDEIWARRIQSLRQHYRQTFRVSQYWQKRIRQIRPDRVGLLDPVTGTRAPANVYQDYCEVPTWRAPVRSKDKSQHKAARNLTNYADKLIGQGPSPAVIAMIDDRLGIFRVEFLPDPIFMTMEIVPSNVDDIPALSVGSPTGAVLWNDARLSKSFNLAVIMSCIFAVPNSFDGKHSEFLEIKEGNKKVVQHLYIRGDNARFSYRDGQAPKFVGNEVVVEGNFFENENVCKALAKAQTEQLKTSWTDRYIGIFSTPRWDDEFAPFAWCQAVSAEWRQDTGFQTVFNMSEPPPPPDLQPLLPQYVKNIVNRPIPERLGS